MQRFERSKRVSVYAESARCKAYWFMWKPASVAAFLLPYSPMHNVKAGAKYPATMVTTSDHDNRVFPVHSFKYSTALHKAHGGDAPILVRIETKAGHSAGKPTTKQIQEQADIYGFLMKSLGVKM